MAKHRRPRINDEMKKEVSEALRGIKDPRVTGAFVTITGAEVTPDLKYAKIYFSHLSGETKEIKKGLDSASGFVRRHVAEKMNLRVTPELSFVYDDSIKYGARISSLLNQIEKSGRSEEEGKNEDEEQV